MLRSDVQQRRDDPQVAGDGRLAGEQRQDPLVHLQVAAVDPVVVGDDHPGQLDVLVAHRLERPVELLDTMSSPPRVCSSSSFRILAELVASLLHVPP